MAEFTPWGKTPRLFRDITITEKLDGTNAAIRFEPGELEGTYAVTAQSRNRVIRPGSDNYGFASWVHENAQELYALLGPGLHFGEWWGIGINRGYGRGARGFAPFNTDKHAAVSADVAGALVEPVPVLYRGLFTTEAVASCLTSLKAEGSVAAPGFMQPEGVCVFHHASRQIFKVTLDNNDSGKWETACSPQS